MDVSLRLSIGILIFSLTASTSDGATDAAHWSHLKCDFRQGGQQLSLLVEDVRELFLSSDRHDETLSTVRTLVDVVFLASAPVLEHEAAAGPARG